MKSIQTKHISRRQFLRITAYTAAAGLALKTGIGWLEESALETVSETRLLMGTVVNLTVVSADPADAQQAITACLDHMAALETILSRFKPESQLSLLNRDGRLHNADPALLHLVAYANDVSVQSDGAFDITIKPLVDLYAQVQSANGQLPTVDQIAEVIRRVDYRQLIVNGTSVAFAQPGMSITLDGIAKGYIVDEGITVLRERGFANVIVEAGGDLLASGRKSAITPWRIGVRAPRADQPGFLARISLEDQAIASSGDYIQAYSADFKHHHIIDPRTGFSSPELAGVTVVASNTAQADALATATMVLGLEAGMDLINSLPGCEALFVTKSLEVVSTQGMSL